MPQVQQKDHAHLKRYLTTNKISYKEYAANPDELKPTQSEFNVDKINSLISNFDKIADMKILVSRDNRVIDGHHRWMAAKKLGKRIEVVKINKRYDNVIDVLTGFSKTFNKAINENKDID